VKTKTYYCKKIKVSACQIIDHRISVIDQFIRELRSFNALCTN